MATHSSAFAWRIPGTVEPGGLPFPTPGDLPNPGIKLLSAVYPELVQFSLVAQSCPALCDTMNRSTPGLPVHHQLLEFTQTHVH